MAGNTATISITAFRADWATHMPIAALCDRYSVTKDQVIRLKFVWSLPPRHDRRLRFKPKERPKDPTPKELIERCAAVRALWDERTEEARRVAKPKPYTVKEIETPPDLRLYVEGEE